MESPSPSADQTETTNCGHNAVTRSKPCREIYRPPNLRKGGSRTEDYPTKTSPTRHTSASSSKSSGGGSKSYSSGHNHNETGESGTEKPKFNVNAKEFCYQPKINRPLPLACHVQYDSSNTFQTIEQQLKAYREEDYMSRNSAATRLMQSKSLGNMLQQDRASERTRERGPLQLQLQSSLAAQATIKPVPEVPNTNSATGRVRGERHPGILISTFLKNNANLDMNMGVHADDSFDRLKLKQSKSSGNVPTGQQHKVRFQDSEENNDDDDDDNEGEDETELVANCLTSLKIKGDESLGPILANQAIQTRKPVTPALAQQQQQLQRSRTLASYLPWSENVGGSGEPRINNVPVPAAVTGNFFPATMNPWLQYFRLQQQQLAVAGRGFLTAAPAAATSHGAAAVGQFFTASVAVSQCQSQTQNHPNSNNPVKRSKSFHSVCPSQSRPHTKPAGFPPMCPSIVDFHITKWPKNVQETITTVVTGVERNVTARHKIEMVVQIFEALFNCKEPGSHRASTNPRELIVPAVHVFMYLLIKEQQNLTIAECLMNTCFETFQVLVQNCKDVQIQGGQTRMTATKNSDNQCLSNTWINFLKFLSTLYSQIKVLRLQPLPGPANTRTIHEMSARILSLTCDVCHATLSSGSGNILLVTSETADHLFMTMTSIGRDMETAYPMKMKQILAAVRDMLLGVNSFHAEYANVQPKSSQPHQNNRLSPCIQKTLMQLIELHAANWNLPASAVRYYYNNSNDTK